MSSVVLSGDTSGTVTVTVPAVAGSNTVTVPAGTGTVAVQGVSTNIVSGTAVASTSGTSIDFTSIPSWVKRITVMFNGVSTAASNSNILIQLGSSSIQTTGYASSGIYGGPSGAGGTSTAGMLVVYGQNAASLFSGNATLTLFSGNSWVCASVLSRTAESYVQMAGGNVTLSGVLDRIRITTSGGTDTFDAGSINILYE
jgi:hypothetical protein